MNKTKQIDHMRIAQLEGIKLMETLENMTQRMMHEGYPELETKYWAARDAQNLRGLRAINEKMRKEIDCLNGVKL